MRHRTRIGLLVIVGVLVGPQPAGAQGGGAPAEAGPAMYADDRDQPLAGEALEKATAAALRFPGEGTVTETEAEGPRGSEVEVRLNDGRQVEVQLDQSFAVVRAETDEDGPGDVDKAWDDD